jgi:hypothetical protein
MSAVRLSISDMGKVQRALLTTAACVTLASGSVAFAQQKNDKEPKPGNPRPRITLSARPPIGTTPQRVVLTAELVGGQDDYEEYYCPSIEWDWGDDTRSESTVDCEPYEAGKSEIRRRFTVEHVFRRPGSFKVFFRMKRRDKAVANQSVTIQIRPGGPPEFGIGQQ